MQTKPGKGKAKPKTQTQPVKSNGKRVLAISLVASCCPCRAIKKKYARIKVEQNKMQKKRGGRRGGNEVEVGRQDIWGGKG